MQLLAPTGLAPLRRRPGACCRIRAARTPPRPRRCVLRRAGGQQPQPQPQQQEQRQQEEEDDADCGGTTPYPSAEASPAEPPRRPGGAPGAAPQPPEPPQEQQGPSLPPQLRRLLVLLTEFGGLYGTAAVAIAWLTHVDPFGNLHWSAGDVALGVRVFLPVLLLDAALMLPDYSLGPEDSRAVAGMFLGSAEVLRSLGGGGDGDGTSGGGEQPGGEAPAPGGAAGALLRVRVGLELLQQVYTKSNPAIGLSPASELLVVATACLADEMLYRGVALTLTGLWLRDRLYEAGADEVVSLALPAWLSGGDGEAAAAAALELPTPELARYLAVGVVAMLGIAGFVAGAMREEAALRRLQVLDRNGDQSEALRKQLVSSLGSQNAVMYGVEGVREVTAGIMAGVSFVSTSNLAAPLAGSLLLQGLFSVYQRLSLARARKKRREVLEEMKVRAARVKKVKAAMAAAAAIKQAEEAVAPTADAAEGSGGDGGGAIEGPSAGSGSEGAASEEAAAAGGGDGSLDFLTAVLQAAEQQQEKQQQQPSSSSSSSSSGTAEAAAAPASGAGGDAARQQLAALLEDMLRSPEGSRVVSQWLGSQSSSGGSDSSGQDPQQTVEELLSDPQTKERLLVELQEQLWAMSKQQRARVEQEQTWRD